MLVDFHLHSLASDGSHSPDIVIKLANEKGIKAISLTDHDTFLGNTEAKKTAQKLNMCYISGVELQADFEANKYEHILAYGIRDFSQMTTFLEEIREERLQNIEKNIKFLTKLGYPTSFEDVDNQTPGRHLTVGHIKKWLKRNFPETLSFPILYESFHSYSEIIQLIKNCGGIAVLAHPFRYNPNFNFNSTAMENHIKKLVNTGLDGIEAYYGTHSPNQIKLCEDIAQKYNLIKTGGSDWHGWSDKSPMGIEMSEKNLDAFFNLLEK